MQNRDAGANFCRRRRRSGSPWWPGGPPRRGSSPAPWPWSPNQAYPPEIVRPGPWLFFTPEEAAVVEAIADRIIPADELGPGGKEAGCAVFIDRQLVGPYGSSEWLYMEPPFVPDAAANFGIQSPVTPTRRYRDGLAALAGYTRQGLRRPAVPSIGPGGPGPGADRA